MSLRKESCFFELAEAVKVFANGDPVVAIANSGNCDDAFVHKGHQELLNVLGIKGHQGPTRACAAVKLFDFASFVFGRGGPLPRVAPCRSFQHGPKDELKTCFREVAA